MTIDSQCHVSSCWYEPVEVLLFQMDRNHIDQAVLVQMIGQTQNDYQQSCLKRYPDRFSSVVWVDPASPDAREQMRRLTDEGATGIRLRPTARSPGVDPLAIWREAQILGLAVSCVGTSADFGAKEFCLLVETLPGLRIVLEHLGGSSQPDHDEQSRVNRLKSFELARFPNVYLKMPGLGELIPRTMPPVAAGNPFTEQVPGVLSEAVNHFGPDRIMWGSDFPPVSSREGYSGAIYLCRQALNFLTPDDQNRIFDGVARHVFKVP